MPNLSDETKFLIDFNVQDVAVALGFNISASAGAVILDTSEADFVAYINEANQTVTEVATRLLSTDESIGAMVNNLSQYKRILAIGDSITTYRYSYARMLAPLLPQAEVINHGYSGYTSNHGLELTHTRFLGLQPDLVFIKYGVNDCKRFSGANGRTLVSADDYRGNISGIINAFQQYSDAKIFLLTPTPIVSEIVDPNEDFKAVYMHWQNRDIKQFSEIVRELSDEFQTKFVDLYSTLGDDPDASLYLADGLHPNFAGHQKILKTIALSFQITS
ncbi:MAG: GDSL-type esterase/lipase family protein [Aggregatilineales bacterium]